MLNYYYRSFPKNSLQPLKQLNIIQNQKCIVLLFIFSFVNEIFIQASWTVLVHKGLAMFQGVEFSLPCSIYNVLWFIIVKTIHLLTV